MTFSYQNENESKRYWSYGRAWLRRSGQWYQRRFGALCIEWTIPAGHNGWGVTFGAGDSGDGLGFTFCLPFIATVYLNIDHFFGRPVVEWTVDEGHDRQVKCYFHDWTFRYSLWVGSMASCSRSYSWCRWWRQGAFDFHKLLGSQRYECVTLKDGIAVTISMPEGVYKGEAKIERQLWKRTFWFKRERVSTTIYVPKGIPFSGKGENSWDCGDDGLFGAGVEGDSVEKAVAHFRESVLDSRRRYGKPSDQAIREALAEVTP